jgi:hypothetical protein
MFCFEFSNIVVNCYRIVTPSPVSLDLVKPFHPTVHQCSAPYTNRSLVGLCVFYRSAMHTV